MSDLNVEKMGKVETTRKELEKAIEEATFCLSVRPNMGEWRDSMKNVKAYIERALSKLEENVQTTDQG